MPQYTNTQLVGATNSALNVTTEAVIKASQGAVFSVDVIVAGTSPGGVYDANSIANAGTANLITNIGTVVGPLTIAAGGFPFKNGLVVNPGTGQTLAVSFR